jgi:peptidoglycan hydrolase-like protein with peptidoglycan-binding domain
MKQIPTKQGVTKLATGTVLGVGMAEFFKENTLKLGMSGDVVKQAQKGLLLTKKTSYPQLNYTGPITGTFDNKTERAVKQLQAYFKLPINGIIDPKLGMALNIDFGPGNIEKLFGKQNLNTFMEKLNAANKWLETTFGSIKGVLKK